jgi:hypothetical protein
MTRQDALEQAVCLLHDARQPLNVINLSCANVRARMVNHRDATDPDYLLSKIAKIEKQIETESTILNNIQSLLTEIQ